MSSYVPCPRKRSLFGVGTPSWAWSGWWGWAGGPASVSSWKHGSPPWALLQEGYQYQYGIS